MTIQTIAEILSNTRIVPEHYKMSLFCPEIAENAKPGQFVHIRCTDQYDPFLRRPFSLHRVLGKNIEILYKVVGKGTALLSKMKSGETLDMLGPLGNGFKIDKKLEIAILAAGGYGVAPLVYLCQDIVRKDVEGLKAIYALLGARTREFVLCEENFKEMEAKVRIRHVRARLTNLLKEKKIARANTCVYSCGPKRLLKSVTEIAHRYGIPCQVSLESHMGCGVGACLCCVIKVGTTSGYTYKRVCKDGPVFSAEEIIWE